MSTDDSSDLPRASRFENRAPWGFPRLRQQGDAESPDRPTEGNNEGSPQAISSDTVGAEAHSPQLHVVLGDANTPLTFLVDDLIGWPAEARQRFYRLLRGLNQPFRLRTTASTEEFTSIFEFALAQMEGPNDAERCTAGQHAAIEAARLFLPNAGHQAREQIASRLQELGILDEQSAGLYELALSVSADAAQPVSVRSVLPTAPIAPTCGVPDGWFLSAAGELLGPANLPFNALVIVRRLFDANGGEILEVAFYRDNVWYTCEISRVQAASQQRLVSAFARAGMQIISTQGRAVMEYVAAYEHVNHDAIPTVRLTRRTGWHDVHGERFFVLGGRVVAAGGNSGDAVLFRAEGDNRAHAAAGVSEGGTLDGWLSTVSAIQRYPRAQFALYAGLVPPLLDILGAPNFVVDFSGPTSRGKTTVLHLAASVWGNPDQTNADSAMLTWDSTHAYRLEIASTLVDMPLIIDETRLAGSNDEVEQFVYSLTSGRTRGRATGGSLSGLSTVLITSGEVPIVSTTRSGGARARVFSLWDSPFGTTTDRTAAVVQGLNRGLLANYGHAGTVFVRYLLEHRNSWAAWREDYQQRVTSMAQCSGGNPVIVRMAEALATVSMAATIAHEALALPWPRQDIVGMLWDDLTEHALDADSATAALEHALDWARGNRHRFYHRGLSRSGPWDGRWDPEGTWIGFRPEALRRVLASGGFDFDSVIRIWRDREWLLLPPRTRKLRYRARIGQENCWLIAIRNTAIQAVEEDASA